MKFVKPEVELIQGMPYYDALDFIEKAYRVCYRSEVDYSLSFHQREKWIKDKIKKGHESPTEHIYLSFDIVTDRGVLAELTRHRICNFSVESTRYVPYKELTFVQYPQLDENDRLLYQEVEDFYLDKKKEDIGRDYMRQIYPLGLATRLIMTANIRQWRHILKQRTSDGVHPYMYDIAFKMLSECKTMYPCMFDDICIPVKEKTCRD